MTNTERVLHVCVMIMLIGTLLFTSPTKAAEVSDEDWCMSQYELAASSMTYRQQGMSLPEMIAKGKSSGLDKAQMVIARKAFSTPRFEIKENREKAVAKYAEDVYNECTDKHEL